MKAGDIILFSGDGVVSNLIKFVQMSKWSHVGVMLSDFELLESTTLTNVTSVMSDTKVKGVQVVNLAERIKSYSGEVAVRPIICASEFRLEYIEKTLKAFAVLHHGKPYEKDELELLMSAIDFIGSNEEDLSSFFCSELVAEGYQRCSLLPDNIPSNEFVPKDFASKSINEVLREVALGPIKMLN